MKRRFANFATACAAVVTAMAVSAHAADLKMKFVYEGDAEKAADIDPTQDREFCGKNPIPDEKLLVNPKNKGIKNVVVYVYTGRGGSDLDDQYLQPANKIVTLANDKCRFEPRIVIAQAGDTLKITNPDAVGHNCKAMFFKNEEFNVMIPAKKHITKDLPKAEPGPAPTECSIHPWMKSYIVVLEHRFAAVSDENGELSITGLPEGELTFRAFHETADVGSVKINGKEEKWKGNRFELDLKAGVTDMGTVAIP